MIETIPSQGHVGQIFLMDVREEETQILVHFRSVIPSWDSQLNFDWIENALKFEFFAYVIT